MFSASSQWIKKIAHSLGFNRVGIIAARPAEHLDAYLTWLSRDFHGQMAYMARSDRVERRQDLNQILPGVRSVVSAALDYHTMSIPEEVATDPSRGRISNYAWGMDYHDIMTPRLKELAGRLVKGSDEDVLWRVHVDTGAVLERDHACSAGLGFFGKNTMLIGPRAGSYFFLGEILTTAELEPDRPPPSMPGCGTCHRCLVACPTGAFPVPFVLDSRRCISYLTIEHRGWIPKDLRPLMDNWIYGCDICQQVCPFNRFSQETGEPGFFPANIDAAAPPLVEILEMDEDEFSKRYRNSPINRIRRRGFVRNACVAAGNWGNEAAVPALADLLFDREPMIRGHAAWALGRIGTSASINELRQALSSEEDDAVRTEIEEAIQSSGRK